MILPPEAHPLVQVLALHFTCPTYQRLSTLLVGALLTTGRRTVANLLRTLRHLAPGHPTDYQRVLSRAPWSGLALGCALMRFALDHLLPDGPVMLVGDDTVDGHKGKCVYGKARHRDAVRSSHSYTAWRYGHKWVVLAVLVRFPFATRPWALPGLVDLYRSEEDDKKRRRPHRTPARIMCVLLRALLMRCPGRAFVFAGDSGYGTREVGRFFHRLRDRLTLVSKLHPDANLFDPPPPYAGKGQPRVKGARRLKPRRAVAATTFTTSEVGWYGGGKRTVRTLDGTGHWYKAGQGLVLLRWVFVRDATGTHRDEYFFTTDPNLTPTAVIGYYCARWRVELSIRDIKQTLGMGVLRGKTPEMLRREIWCHLLAYNLVRQVIAQSAREREVSPHRISFAGAQQTLDAFRVTLQSGGGESWVKKVEALLWAIGGHRVGERPDRCEPREVKSRPKSYRRMTRPRATRQAELMTAADNL